MWQNGVFYFIISKRQGKAITFQTKPHMYVPVDQQNLTYVVFLILFMKLLILNPTLFS